METIFLSPAPMPYLTDCQLKRFGINEYHCSRFCGYFVLIFMLKNTLQFTENEVMTTLRPGDWYIQKKNTWQDASLPSPKAEYYYIHFEASYTEDRTSRLMLPIRGTFRPVLFLPLLQHLERLRNQTPCSHLELQSEFFRLLGLLYTQEQSYTPLTAALMRYVNENYASRITGEHLSEIFHYSSEYIDKKMKQELGRPDTLVVATGGMAVLISDESKVIDKLDGLLTLKGLRIIYERNSAEGRDAK